MCVYSSKCHIFTARVHLHRAMDRRGVGQLTDGQAVSEERGERGGEGENQF